MITLTPTNSWAQDSAKASRTETKIGTRLPSSVNQRQVKFKNHTSTQAVRVFYGFARCVVGKRPASVADFIARGNIVGPEREELWPGSRREMGECLGRRNGGMLHADVFLYVGAWAEQLYLRNFAALPALADGDLTPTSFEKKDENRELLKFADCVVRATPEGVDGLMRTKVASEEESVAFQRIAPNFEPCVDKGGSIATSKFTLRLAVANALYRRAVGLVGAPQVTGVQ